MKTVIKAIISKLFCLHSWEVLQDIKHIGPWSDTPERYEFLYTCKKCGKMYVFKSTLNYDNY